MKTILISCLQLSKRNKTSKHPSEAERVELKDACQRESLRTDQEKMGIFQSKQQLTAILHFMLEFYFPFFQTQYHS